MERKKIETLWTHLHWLTVLAEQGSYTAAAARLHVSKAAMSQRISELERVIGVPLVRRTTRSMRLTEAGERLVGEITTSYAAIAASFVGAKDAARELQGLVRITAPVALARQHLVPMIAEFLEIHPGVKVELEMSDRIRSLSSDGFDLAVRHSASVPGTGVAWQLCKSESVFVASDSYLKLHRAPDQPSELVDHACLHYPRDRDEVVWSLERGNPGTRSHKRVSVAVSGPLAANNSEALRDAAAAGLGVALIPDFSASAMLRSGELIRVLPGWRSTGTFSDRIYALRPYSPRVPRAVDELVQHLKQRFKVGFSAA